MDWMREKYFPIMEELLRSKLSVKEFGAEKDIKRATLYDWRGKKYLEQNLESLDEGFQKGFAKLIVSGH